MSAVNSRCRRRRFMLLTPSVLDLSGGTKFGDMINQAGLAASFDGNTNQSNVQSSQKTAATDAYVGVTPLSPVIVKRATLYGTNNSGFAASGATNVTLTLYGKQGAAPATSSDGTVLGTAMTLGNIPNDTKIIVSSDLATAWDHVWLRVQGSSSDNLRCAELRVFGL